MRKLLSTLFVGILILFTVAPVVAVATSTPAGAAGPAPKVCAGDFLGIPAWYRGLTDADCNIISPSDAGGLSDFIWRIVLNGIEIALVITAYIAIFFILYGGFLFITGGSNPSQVERARKSILNAVIGLVISLGAIAITRFIFGVIGSAGANANGIVELTSEQLLHNGLNIAYFVAGTASVIVIIIAGIMYATSSGDAGRVARAKNMLVYSIAGLVVILVAFAVTNFVIGRFS